jgi:hypothetical protein
MKIHLLALFTLKIIFFAPINGQENIKYANHIGINVLSLKYVSENYIPTGFKLHLPVGMTFKKDYQHITARYSLNYDRTKTEYKFTGPDSYTGFNYYTVSSISSGIQKNISFGKFSMFYGLDLFGNFSIYKVDYSGGFTGQGLHEKSYHLWVGLSPVIGFQFNIVPRVSLSFETNYNLAFRIINTDYEQSTNVNSFQHYINPINALTIFYNF